MIKPQTYSDILKNQQKPMRIIQPKSTDLTTIRRRKKEEKKKKTRKDSRIESELKKKT